MIHFVNAKSFATGAVLIIAIASLPATVSAQSQDEPIYGRQLMTEQERSEYRNQMRSAKTQEEREKIRAQHHEEIKARAKSRGVTLPDDPAPKGMGYGRGGPAGKGPDGKPRGPGPGSGTGR